MNLKDEYTRVRAAYYRFAGNADDIKRQPSSETGDKTINGRRYLTLFNTNGVLAVYRVRNNGLLKLMKRYPKQLNEI